MHNVTVIVGPTSSGKTSFALKIAKEQNADIISADSRQIYKYMDIGTGKLPVKTEINVEKSESFWLLNGIKVWGYDLVEPGQYFSAYDFAVFARNKINELNRQNRKILLVGGTGFYVDAVTGRVQIAQSTPNPDLRKSLENKSLSDLQEKLKRLNPSVFETIDVKNPRRVLRAIEKELSKKSAESEPLPNLPNAEFSYTGLTGERELLYSRADTWLEEVWQNGLLEETGELIKHGYGNTPQIQGLIYKSAVSYVSHQIDEITAKNQAKFDLHAYIRRQQTWFKKNPNIKWTDISKIS